MVTIFFFFFFFNTGFAFFIRLTTNGRLVHNDDYHNGNGRFRDNEGEFRYRDSGFQDRGGDSKREMADLDNSSHDR